MAGSLHHSNLSHLPMKWFALLGYATDNGFSSLVGSDQLLPLDGRCSLNSHLIAAEAQVLRMVRVQPHVSAFQICSGSLKSYTVQYYRTYTHQQVLMRQIEAAAKDLAKDGMDFRAATRLFLASSEYHSLLQEINSPAS